MKQITVAGMSCQHCVGSVKGALEALGLQNVTVDLDSGVAAFSETTQMSEAQAKAAIEDIGFDVTAIA